MSAASHHITVLLEHTGRDAEHRGPDENRKEHSAHSKNTSKMNCWNWTMKSTGTSTTLSWKRIALFFPPEEEEPMPRHVLHAAHSASVTGRSARILRWIFSISSCFLSSSSSSLCAAWRRNFTVRASTVSAAVSASNGVERRGPGQPRYRP